MQSTLTRLLRRITGLAAERARRLDQPWQEHARRNASTATAALRREREGAEAWAPASPVHRAH
ncbi:hypothetical protein [Streptacidiphilus pinicola]|uniref:hypothetical protein n=1 Tax=Streptacidiphilus pinicola TaxID=2219663 RepID=UPI001057E1D6|nr:hypothetical protein [Streptacidiphilus pinicola]